MLWSIWDTLNFNWPALVAIYFMTHLPHGILSPLHLLFSPPCGLSSDLKMENAKPHISVSCPAICCQYLYSPIKNNLGDKVTQHHLYMCRFFLSLGQPGLRGQYLALQYRHYQSNPLYPISILFPLLSEIQASSFGLSLLLNFFGSVKFSADIL